MVSATERRGSRPSRPARDSENAWHGVLVVSPDLFINVPVPPIREICLALFAGKRVIGMLEEFAPEAIHIATEGRSAKSREKFA